jgi:hypothetical protein
VSKSVNANAMQMEPESFVKGPLDSSGVRVKVVFPDRLTPAAQLGAGAISCEGELTVNGLMAIVQFGEVSPMRNDFRYALIPLSQCASVLVRK